MLNLLMPFQSEKSPPLGGDVSDKNTERSVG
jgi:hypothetical protein